jgi:outer membrane protein W
MIMLLSTQSMSIFASEQIVKNNVQDDVNNIKENYNEIAGTYKHDSGSVSFKAKAFYTYMSTDQEMSKPPTVADPKLVNGLITTILGADTAATIYFNSNIAFEMGAGFAWIKSDTKILENISSNYGITPKISAISDMYMIPITAIFQYHIAAFGGFCPYIGLGYHGNYFINSSENFKIDNNHGPVIQLGINFINKDDTIFTLDIKKYFVTNIVTYSEKVVEKNNITSKMKANPLSISLGVGFKF